MSDVLGVPPLTYVVDLVVAPVVVIVIVLNGEQQSNNPAERKNAYLGQFWSDLNVLYVKTH